MLGRVLTGYVPVAEDLDPRTKYIVDGTLLPCWSWASQPGLYSGKHKTTGMDVPVVCDLSGPLTWVSYPVEGRRHDTAALQISGVLDTLTPTNWLGDKGYIGNNMITSRRKPAHRKLEWEKQFNTAVNKIRYPLPHRTNHREHKDLADPAHRLPQTPEDILGEHFNGHRPRFLQDPL